MRYLYSLLFLLSLSCSTVNHKYFTYCSNGELRELDKKIKLNGYYVSSRSKGLSTILLYNDYSYANLWIAYKQQKEIEDYFNKPDKRYFQKKLPLQWGGYKILNDTIKSQFFYLRDFHYEMEEIWYVIDNDSTLSLVESICPQCKREGIWENDGVAICNPPHVYHFVPFAQKPDSTSWLKKKRWYWCK